MSAPIVLIADPDCELAELYRRYLAEEGFDVSTAANSLQCLASLQAALPDVLVLDPELPEGSDAVLDCLYGEGAAAPPPVVVLAAGRDLEALYRAAAFPISEWRDKPCEPWRLAECLRAIVGGQVAAAARGADW
jgi:DNA-binding response OmpR family regulator